MVLLNCDGFDHICILAIIRQGCANGSGIQGGKVADPSHPNASRFYPQVIRGILFVEVGLRYGGTMEAFQTELSVMRSLAKTEGLAVEPATAVALRA
jgi:hypothetical protein